jgi:tetratricopeptide (TPR) repeat protein
MEQRVDELAAYRDSLAIRRRLAELDPTNAQWRHDEACILDHIGNVNRKAGEAQDAIAAYAESVAILRQLANLARRDRQRQLNVTMSLKKLGDVKLEAADHKGAIAAYKECVVFWRRILKTDPDNARWLSRFVETLERIGDLKLEAGDNNAALGAYEEMLSVDRQLVGIDASNAERRWNLSLSLERIGEVNLILGNLDAAGAAYDESLIIRHRFVDADPCALWQDGIARMQKKIVEFREAKALAEASGPRPELLSEPDKIRRELQEQLLLSVGRLRDMGDIVIKRVLTAYQESFTVVRSSIAQNAMLRVGEVCRKLSLSFAETNARVGSRLRRYWREGETFMKSVSPKVWVGVQGLGHATETARLGLIQLLSWSALKGISRVSFQFDTSTEEPGTGFDDEKTTATASGDAAISISLNAAQALLDHRPCYAHQKG